MSTLLGVTGRTGQPKGGTDLQPSPLNVVGLTGRFSRQYSDMVNIDGEFEIDWILGSPKKSLDDWLIIRDFRDHVRPQKAIFKFYPYKASDSVQASVTIVDSAAVNTLTLSSAYHDTNSYGTDDNNTSVRIAHATTLTITNTAATDLSSTLTIPVSSVQGLYIGDVLQFMVGLVSHSVVVASLDEMANTITVTTDGTTPIIAINSDLNVKKFTIKTYRKDFRGFVQQAQTPFENEYFSMESTHPDYVVNKLKDHPFFKGVDATSASLAYNKFPVETTVGTYVYLTGGLDGTAPATVADWSTVQAKYEGIRLNYFLNTGTTASDVRKDYIAWCQTRDDFPMYLQPLPYVANNFNSLITHCRDFLTRVGWKQTTLIYGNRYIADPVSDIPNGTRLISRIGFYLGKRIKAIYEGRSNLSVAVVGENMLNDTKGLTPIYEDNRNVWTQEVRQKLYDAGCNLIQYREEEGAVRLLNERTPSNDWLVRDAHIHIINQLIKFNLIDLSQSLENTPAKFNKVKSVVTNISNVMVLKKLYDANFPPFVIVESPFQDVNASDAPAVLSDITATIINRFNNPKEQFNNGDVRVDVSWQPYSLIRSLLYTVYPENRG